MTHRPSRDALALALRRYVSRRITNDQLDSVAVDWRDRGAVAVQGMAWRLYDDMYTHKAVGKHRLSPAARHEIARWVAFLHSSQEYAWPEYNLIHATPGIGSLLTFGWWGRKEARRWREFTEAGDFDVWPFIDRRSELEARSAPRFMVSGDA